MVIVKNNGMIMIQWDDKYEILDDYHYYLTITIFNWIIPFNGSSWRSWDDPMMIIGSWVRKMTARNSDQLMLPEASASMAPMTTYTASRCWC